MADALIEVPAAGELIPNFCDDGHGDSGSQSAWGKHDEDILHEQHQSRTALRRNAATPVGGGAVRIGSPATAKDLLQSERRFMLLMQAIGFGRFERLAIRAGELSLDPWPTLVREVKFGARGPLPSDGSDEFRLKKQIPELFEYVRGVDDGEIRILEVRHGLPFSMEIEMLGAHETQGGQHG